jgi:antibiotic biosynthesis monooxygenase (ABM) superfamily enzyme
MSTPAVLIATAKVRPGSEEAFAAWQGRHEAAVSKFAGFIGSDIVPPTASDEQWTLLLNFDSRENLTAWQQSKERAASLAELVPLTTGGDFGEIMPAASHEAAEPETTVTQVIFSRVKPGMEARYRDWSARIQHAQSRYPGYRGTFLQPPPAGSTRWVTMLRFDSSEHLNAWLASPERAEMLKETGEFIEGEELVRLATSFPGWVPINPSTGQAPPNWATALLVLVGLYPIVALELKFLNPLLAGWPPSVGMFTGNVLSVAATSFVTMPLLIRAFSWWLFIDMKKHPRNGSAGVAILAVIFAVEICLVELLFRATAS